LGRADALNTVSAFLHDAAATDGYLGIAAQPEAFGGEIGVLEKIETPYLVRAVVGTIARADAAVVDHVVEPVGTVNCCPYRANQLARCVLTLHARHRLKEGFRVGQITSVVAIDSKPVHFPSMGDLGLADDRDIVLGLARDDAGAAADACA